LGAKFTAGAFEGLLQELAGNARISDLAKPAVLTSYDLRGREVMNFSTHDACAIDQDDAIRFQRPGNPDFFRKDKNVLLWQAIRASSAAPVFYNPLEIEIGGKHRALIDAGLFVMSPALLAWIEAQKVYPGRPLIIISISSGTLLEERKVDTKGLAAGSIPKVVQPTIETALEGQQALTDLMMRDLPGIQYYRLSFDVKNKQFDDTSDKNMKALIEAANVTIASGEFKKAVKAISDARLERKRKQDLKPYICQAKERQKENQKTLVPAHKVSMPAEITNDKILRKIEEAYNKKKTEEPIPEEMKAQIQLLKAECQNLLNQKKTMTPQWKNNHCDNVMSPKEICDSLSTQKQTKEWKNRGCKKIIK
jgi:predicted acylesterase/phospholipase RssA